MSQNITSQFLFNKDKEFSVESSECFSGSVDMKVYTKKTASSAVVVYFPSPDLVIRYRCFLEETVEMFIR